MDEDLERLAEELEEIANDLTEAVMEDDIEEAVHLASQAREKLKEITVQIAEIQREED